MGTIRKLRRSGQLAKHMVEPLRHGPPPSFTTKMSQVLQDFAEPLLEKLGEEEFEAGMSLAALCWNLTFMPPKDQHKQIKSIIDALGKSDPLMRIEVEEHIRMLMERKKALYANDRRIIIDYEFVIEEGRPRLLVISTPVKD